MTRHPFISVYTGAAACMVGQYVRAWSRKNRESREYRIHRTQGFRPVYRINIRFKEPQA